MKNFWLRSCLQTSVPFTAMDLLITIIFIISEMLTLTISEFIVKRNSRLLFGQAYSALMLLVPFFRRYSKFIENELLGLLEDVPLAQISDMYFQQDGAPPHRRRVVSVWTSNTFGAKWIERDGSTRCPARSPDITPIDSFLWEDYQPQRKVSKIGSETFLQLSTQTCYIGLKMLFVEESKFA